MLHGKVRHRTHVYDYPWRSGKYNTLEGLLSLLECCPGLRKICLPLDARVVPVDTGDIICNPALTFPDPRRSAMYSTQPNFRTRSEGQLQVNDKVVIVDRNSVTKIDN